MGRQAESQTVTITQLASQTVAWSHSYTVTQQTVKQTNKETDKHPREQMA
jgi:hypothetical protein